MGPAVAICVPARNEEALLPALLDALREVDRGSADVVLCVHLDACVDDSAAVLTRAAAMLPYPMAVSAGAVGEPNAGRARAAAMALGLEQIGGRQDAVLLSTDADSRPRRDWLQAALNALRESDVTAGRIVRRASGDDAQARLERYYDRLHAYRRAVDPVPWDAAGGTHHGGGANLAIRAGAYRALGGFRALPAGEDAALLDDAARAGFRVRRDPAMVVETSSRRHGRAPGGLADALRAIDVAGLAKLQHPAAAAWQYRHHAAARAAFERVDDTRVRQCFGGAIGLSADHVLGVARDCPNAEAFAMRIVPAAPDAGTLVTLSEAERVLSALEAALCRGAA